MEPIKPPSQQRRSPLPHSKTSRISITKTRAAAFLPRIRLSRKALPVLPFLSGVRSLPVRFFGNAAAASSKTWITPGSCNSSSAGGRTAEAVPLSRAYHRYGNPYHYRNKVSAAFALARNQQIISGVYQDSTHRIVPVDHCLIEDPKADEIICSIRRLMKSFKLLPYDEVTQKGFLRHVLIKRGFATNQIMVVLVTSTPVFPAKKRFTEALLKLHPEITTILMNLNDRYTSMVLGEQEKVLYGPGKIQDILCGCRFQISAKSFYQINPAQTEALYLKAMEYAGLTGSETVIDAYCGIGTIGLVAAKRGAKKVVGVELNRDAVKDAIENAKLNKLSNAWFCAGDAGEFMLEMSLEKEPADVVFMDPPRAGSDRTFLSSLIALSPKKVVYISCNPETQQRDLRYLTSKGPYRVTRIQPVDMFPHTNHVETVALLQKQYH